MSGHDECNCIIIVNLIFQDLSTELTLFNLKILVNSNSYDFTLSTVIALYSISSLGIHRTDNESINYILSLSVPLICSEIKRIRFSFELLCGHLKPVESP